MNRQPRLLLRPFFSANRDASGSNLQVPHIQVGHHGTGNDGVSPETSIDMNIDDGNSEKERLYYSQEFQLPQIVRSRIEADVQQATAFAITTALFAAVLASLAQLVIIPDNQSPAWRTLHFFTYSSIIINLSGTTLALVLVKMCTELPYTAHRLTLTDPSSLPARVVLDGIPRQLMLHRYKLLEEFGMPRGYKLLDAGASFWVLSGNIFTFVSVMLWIWLASDITIAAVTTVAMVLPIFGLTYAIALTKH